MLHKALNRFIYIFFNVPINSFKINLHSIFIFDGKYAICCDVNIVFVLSVHYLHCFCISGCLCKFSATPRSRELRGLTVMVTSESGRD